MPPQTMIEQSYELDLNAVYRLSRFVTIRPAGNGFCIETPRNAEALVLDNPRIFTVFLLLQQDAPLGDVLAWFTEEERPLVLRVLARADQAEMLTRVQDGEAEEDEGALGLWGHHDLLFHARSRPGRNRAPIGGTFRFAGKRPPHPAVKPFDHDVVIPFPEPDAEAIAAASKPLETVLEQRASRYHYDRDDLSAETLATFLFRCARVRGQKSVPVSPLGIALEITKRSYPSGGASYPLEIYPIVNRCQNIPRGIYHYDPLGHRLGLVSARAERFEPLLEQARVATGRDWQAPILLVFAARFGRTMWKYQSIAYSVILKEVGCLMQTAYLVATDMGLAISALGSGNTESFAAATGNDFYQESSVGEMILGPALRQ